MADLFRRIWDREPIALGPRGEWVAARFLRSAGYRVVAKNLRNRFGEIDLLAETPDRRATVVVEVKAGRGGGLRPELRVNLAKQQRLASLAAQLVCRYHLRHRAMRFNVIGVNLPTHGQPAIRHHVGAFESHV